MVRKREKRKGNMAVIMAFAIGALLYLAALAVDINYVRTSQFELRNAADAAAHAALVELRRSGDTSKATDLAVEVASMNEVAGAPYTLTPEDLTFGLWDWETDTFTAGSPTPNSVQVETQRREGSMDGPIRLFVGPALGYDALSASASTTGAFRFRDVMVVQDITTSFYDEMWDAVTADVQFLDYMYTRKLPNDRIGMYTFVGAAKQISALSYVESQYSTIRTKWWGDGRTNKDVRKRSGLTHCYQFRGMPGVWNPLCRDTGGGNTSPGRGIKAAADELIAKSSGETLKVIVLVSDGAPTAALPGTTGETAAWRKWYGTAMADYAYANDIHIWTVSMNTTHDPVQKAYMASLVRGYGVAYDTPTSSDLQEILVDIASSIPIALVE